MLLPSVSIMLKIFLFLFIIRVGIVESCSGKKIAQNAANDMRKGIEEASKNVQTALEETSKAITGSIDNAVSRFEILGKIVATELGQSIRQASSDLVKISEKVTGSIDKGVHEMSSVMRDAISTTEKITDRLLESADKAVDKVGMQIENAVDAVREIASDLTKSIDKGVAELGTTLRYVADKMAEMAKQIEVKIDSNHLVGVANSSGEALIRSVQELTTNWELAVNTADFKDVGQGAAAELSKALQNLRVYLEVHVGMDDNTRRAVKYIAVAVCIAFSVCFIAMVIAVKSCRACTVQLFMLIIEKCKSTSSNTDESMERAVDASMEEKPVSISTARPNDNKLQLTSFDKTPLRKENNSMKITSDYDSDSDTETDKNNYKKPGSFIKRQTKSLADYNAFSTIRNKWERRANRNARMDLSTYTPD